MDKKSNSWKRTGVAIQLFAMFHIFSSVLGHKTGISKLHKKNSSQAERWPAMARGGKGWQLAAESIEAGGRCDEKAVCQEFRALSEIGQHL